MADKYEVGYRKPPKEKQFMQGRSGNPKGRPKGSKNLSTLFREIAGETIEVTSNGRVKIMTRKQAIVLQLANRALSGELRSMKEFIYLLKLAEGSEESEQTSTEPGERDIVLMKNILERMTRMKQEPEQPESSTKATDEDAQHNEFAEIDAEDES